MEKLKTYYRRHLPHYNQEYAQYHVVFRLAGSLPTEVIEQLRIQREEEEHRIENMGSEGHRIERWYTNRKTYFEKFDALLDGSSKGPCWLHQGSIAAIVHEAILYRNGKEYDLYASTIMPNHVHMVFELAGRNDIPTYSTKPFFRIFQSLKRYTARECNRLLKRRGAFWQDESYDHIIRNEKELERTIWYVLSNPVNAGLVQSWEEWPWTYTKLELLEAVSNEGNHHNPKSINPIIHYSL